MQLYLFKGIFKNLPKGPFINYVTPKGGGGGGGRGMKQKSAWGHWGSYHRSPKPPCCHGRGARVMNNQLPINLSGPLLSIIVQDLIIHNKDLTNNNNILTVYPRSPVPRPTAASGLHHRYVETQ